MNKALLVVAFLVAIVATDYLGFSPILMVTLRAFGPVLSNCLLAYTDSSNPPIALASMPDALRPAAIACPTRMLDSFPVTYCTIIPEKCPKAPGGIIRLLPALYPARDNKFTSCSDNATVSTVYAVISTTIVCISTLGKFSTIDSNCSLDNSLGALNLSRASLASRACAFASAARALALAIAARATSASPASRAVSLLTVAIRSSAAEVSRFASAVCNSSAEVLHSDWVSRMFIVRHCSNRNTIEKHAPTAVIIPANSSPFQAIGYQYSAQASSWESIGDDDILFFSTIVVVLLSPIFLIIFVVVFLWQTRRRF